MFTRNMLRAAIGCLFAVGLSPTAWAVAPVADPQGAEGRLYYTRYSTNNAQEANVKYVQFGYDYTNGIFGLNTPQNVARTVGADGIIFDPTDTNYLLVTGQGFQHVSRVKTDGSSIVTKTTAQTDAWHIKADPRDATPQKVWVGAIPGYDSGNPGKLVEMSVVPFSDGVGHNISGHDLNVTDIAFYKDGSGTWHTFYTSSDPGGDGHFGTINMTTFQTTRTIANPIAAAHGMILDPFTMDLILVGDRQIVQIDPDNPGVIKSQITFASGGNYDQVSVDGRGHIFMANNDGNLTFIDYKDTGLLATHNFMSTLFLDTFLDDIAPLAGPGAPEPASLMMLALGGLMLPRRRKPARI